MAHLFIICGLPGSGKTALAKALSSRLNIACIHKDAIKEQLYELRNLKSLEHSKKIGNESIQLMFKLAKAQIANNIDIIIEAPFTFAGDYNIFASWKDQYQLQIYAIICSIPRETREVRFRGRLRHQAHHDSERTFTDKDLSIYNGLPGRHITVVTDKPIELLVDEVIKKLKKQQLRCKCTKTSSEAQNWSL